MSDNKRALAGADYIRSMFVDAVGRQRPINIPALENYQPPPVMCVSCGLYEPRMPGAQHCLKCSEDACVLGGDDAWFTMSKGEYARASRRKSECEHCESCFGTGWVSYEETREGLSNHPYTFTKPCPGQSLDRRLELFNEARCPGLHHKCRFGDEVSAGDGGWADVPVKEGNATEVHKRVKQWAELVKPGQPDQKGILLGGTHGTGKTHLLVAAIKHLTIKRGIQCRYMDWGDLIAEMRQGFGKGQDADQVLAPYMQTRVLVLDELGKGSATDWRLEALEALIERRYRNQELVTVAATNLDDEVMRTKLGERIMSRLAAGCRQVAMVGKDWRRK